MFLKGKSFYRQCQFFGDSSVSSLRWADKCSPRPLSRCLVLHQDPIIRPCLTNIAKASPIVIISMVLFAPFLEEIVFRRVIFGGVYMKTNFWIAALSSALVFAAVHNEFEHLLIYLMPALVFAYLYYRTKRY